MHTTLKTLVATAAAALSLSAMAVDRTVDPTNNQGDQSGLTTQQQQKRDLKTESKAEYKARKDIADVNKDLEIADCKTAGLESKDVRDCKRDAKDSAKAAKHEAKEIHNAEKDAIKAYKAP